MKDLWGKDYGIVSLGLEKLARKKMLLKKELPYDTADLFLSSCRRKRTCGITF